jgi:hypothetical protein
MQATDYGSGCAAFVTNRGIRCPQTQLADRFVELLTLSSDFMPSGFLDIYQAGRYLLRRIVGIEELQMFKPRGVVLLVLISGAFFVQDASAEVGFCTSGSTQCDWLEDTWGGTGSNSGGNPTYYQCAAKASKGQQCRKCHWYTNGSNISSCAYTKEDAGCSCTQNEYSTTCKTNDSCLYLANS